MKHCSIHICIQPRTTQPRSRATAPSWKKPSRYATERGTNSITLPSTQPSPHSLTHTHTHHSATSPSWCANAASSSKRLPHAPRRDVFTCFCTPSRQIFSLDFVLPLGRFMTRMTRWNTRSSTKRCACVTHACLQCLLLHGTPIPCTHALVLSGGVPVEGVCHVRRVRLQVQTVQGGKGAAQEHPEGQGAHP